MKDVNYKIGDLVQYRLELAEDRLNKKFDGVIAEVIGFEDSMFGRKLKLEIVDLSENDSNDDRITIGRILREDIDWIQECTVLLGDNAQFNIDKNSILELI